jgi:hypothetical protein
MSDLIKYEAARHALTEAKQADEVMMIRDKARAIQAAAMIAKDKQLEIDASEIRIRAERRLGEMIRQQKETEGLNKGEAGRFTGGTNEEPPAVKPTLASVGISKKLSSRSQAIAAIPEEEFEEVIEEHREQQQAVTAATMDKLAKKGKAKKEEVRYKGSNQAMIEFIENVQNIEVMIKELAILKIPNSDICSAVIMIGKLDELLKSVKESVKRRK